MGCNTNPNGVALQCFADACKTCCSLSQDAPGGNATCKACSTWQPRRAGPDRKVPTCVASNLTHVIGSCGESCSPWQMPRAVAYTSDTHCRRYLDPTDGARRKWKRCGCTLDCGAGGSVLLFRPHGAGQWCRDDDAALLGHPAADIPCSFHTPNYRFDYYWRCGRCRCVQFISNLPGIHAPRTRFPCVEWRRTRAPSLGFHATAQ